MVKQSKIFEVENVTAKIRDAKMVALADYRGLTVSQATQLRDKIKEAGGNLQVIKNTLLLRALKENSYQTENIKLEGQNITLFSEKDEVSPLKILAGFAKTASLLPFKIGFMAGKILSADDLDKLAVMPTKIELQGKLVGLLFSQPSRLVYALNYNIQKLVIVLSKIKKDN